MRYDMRHRDARSVKPECNPSEGECRNRVRLRISVRANGRGRRGNSKRRLAASKRKRERPPRLDRAAMKIRISPASSLVLNPRPGATMKTSGTTTRLTTDRSDVLSSPYS